MRLIVGLGNPGKQYERTRHNIGFLVVNHLAGRHQLTGAKTKFHAGVLDGSIAQQRCILMQPMTYMNRSGQAVREALNFYKLEPHDLLVVVDDVALPCGKLRMRPGGSSGGHNGLIDIESTVGTQQYPRLRVGIDPPGRMVQSDYVLGRFTPAQWQQMEPAIDRACDAVEGWLSDDIERVMSRFNADEAAPP